MDYFVGVHAAGVAVSAMSNCAIGSTSSRVPIPRWILSPNRSTSRLQGLGRRYPVGVPATDVPSGKITEFGLIRVAVTPGTMPL
jgi:hypothetical protein